MIWQLTHDEAPKILLVDVVDNLFDILEREDHRTTSLVNVSRQFQHMEKNICIGLLESPLIARCTSSWDACSLASKWSIALRPVRPSPRRRAKRRGGCHRAVVGVVELSLRAALTLVSRVHRSQHCFAPLLPDIASLRRRQL